MIIVISRMDYLSQFRIQPKSGKQSTHLTYGLKNGAYSLSVEQEKTLYEVMSTGKNYSILERPPKDASNVKFDLDFRQHQEHRQFDNLFVKTIIQVLFQIIDKNVTPKTKYPAFVFQRDAPYYKEKQKIYSDGLHIQIPDLVMEYSGQHQLRHDFIKAIQTSKTLEHALSTFENPLEDIVDECIIQKNGWFMYGQGKYGLSPYKCTKVFYSENNEVMSMDFSDFVSSYDMNLVEYFSIRNKTINAIYKKPQVVLKKKSPQKKTQGLSNDGDEKITLGIVEGAPENKYILELCSCLSVDRVNNMLSWMELGMILKNELGESGFDVWVNISKQSKHWTTDSVSYSQGYWHKFQHMKNGLRIGTLVFWAKEDSPDKYQSILSSNVFELIKRANAGADYDIACIAHKMYQDEFKFSQNKIWYRYSRHKWVIDDQGMTIRKRISTNLFNEFMKVSSKLSYQATQEEDETKINSLREMSIKLQKTASKLKSSSFKDKLMKEMGELFYESDFYEKLDQDGQFIGFNNGVYDLTKGVFRPGCPDDFISMTTKRDWKTTDTSFDFSDFVTKKKELVQELKSRDFEDDPEQKERIERLLIILNMLSQILPDAEIRDYVLKNLAQCLDGTSINDKFHIFTGSGGNGKSILVNLYRNTFGDYCKTLPINVLTSKRGNANAAAPFLADTKGIRFTNLQEPDEGESINIGLMKELSGQDTITVRKLFRDPFEMTPMFKMFLMCNILPRIQSLDDGTWRRIRVVHFGSRFVSNPQHSKYMDMPNVYKKDEKLAYLVKNDTIIAEVFMELLIRKYIPDIAKHGMDEPDAVIEFTKKYEQENDIVSQFIQESIVKISSLSPEQKLKVQQNPLKLSDAYRCYKDWMKNAFGDEKPKKQKDFKSELEKTMGQYGLYAHGNAGWNGYCLREMIEEYTSFGFQANSANTGMPM